VVKVQGCRGVKVYGCKGEKNKDDKKTLSF